MNEKQHFIIVGIFATAMAWVESATVIYLRTLVGRLQPYQPNPLTLGPGTALAGTEAIREAATLLMLITVGLLAGRSWRSRLAYMMIAFGIWDILYYVFLAVIGPWPRSILDWDVLFLLPLPWWGPVLSPVAISILLILSGTLISQFDQPDRPLWPRAWAVAASLAGAGVALYVFMQDAIGAIALGSEALGKVLPTQFNGWLFTIGLILMTIPLIDLSLQVWQRSHPSQAKRTAG